MNVIYVDELFFLNALTDYLLLLSCARLRGRALRRTRFAAAAALGGVYAVFAAIPPLSFLVSLAVKALVSLLMAWIAFGAPPELGAAGAAFSRSPRHSPGRCTAYRCSPARRCAACSPALRSKRSRSPSGCAMPRCGSFSGGF